MHPDAAQPTTERFLTHPLFGSCEITDVRVHSFKREASKPGRPHVPKLVQRDRSTATAGDHGQVAEMSIPCRIHRGRPPGLGISAANVAAHTRPIPSRIKEFSRFFKRRSNRARVRRKGCKQSARIL